jgi:hypothetical protein
MAADLRHPELVEFITAVDNGALQNVKQNQQDQEQSRLALQLGTIAPTEETDFQKNTKFLTSFRDNTTIPVASFLDILRASRTMADQVAARATAMAQAFAPTAPIVVDGQTITPEQFQCFLQKATYQKPPSQPQSATDLARVQEEDDLAKKVADKADQLQSSFMIDFGLMLLKLLLRIVLKFVITLIFKPICAIFGAVDSFTKGLTHLQDDFNNAFGKLFGIYPCRDVFILEDEMKANVFKQALAGQKVPESAFFDFSDAAYQQPQDCTPEALAGMSPADQAQAQQMVAKILAQETQQPGFNSIKDVLNDRGTFTGIGQTKTDNSNAPGTGGFIEMTVGDRIAAGATEYSNNLTRMEHKVSDTVAQDPAGVIEKPLYDMVLNINNALQSFDVSLSSFTDMNINTPGGSFSLKSFICCALRLLYTLLVVENDKLDPATKQKIQDYMEKGIGYTADTKLNDILGPDAMQEIQVFAALFDAVLGRLLGDTSISLKVTNISDWFNMCVSNLIGDLIDAGVESLSMLFSTVMSYLEKYVVSLYLKSPTIQEAITLCEPVDKMFQMVLCGIKELKLKMFDMLANQWRKNNQKAIAFEAMYDIKMNYKNVSLFSKLLEIVLKADVRLRNVCGLSTLASADDASKAVDSIMNDLGIPPGAPGTKPPTDSTGNPIPPDTVKLLTTPVYDPTVQLGPEPDYICTQMFRKSKHGGMEFNVSTNRMYNPYKGKNDAPTTSFESPAINNPMGNCARDVSDLIREMTPIVGGIKKDVLG